MASKLSAVLDEKTLLNFKFVYKLAKRYKFLSCSVPLLVVALSLFLYKAQNEIHSSNISFRYISERSTSSSTAMTVLLSDNAKSSGTSEVLSIVNSTNFLQALAKDIFSDPEINDFNFNKIFSKNNASFLDFTGDCRSDECKIGFLRVRLPYFFSVTEDAIVESKFNLTVKTLSRFTTDKIIYYIANNVERFRLKTLNYQLQHKIEITEKLIQKQKDKAVSAQVIKAMEEKSVLEADLKSIMSKALFYDKILNEKKISLEQEGISLKYTKSTLQRKVSSKDKAEWGKAKKLILKKELLMADITALEHTVGEKSAQDNSVIKNLKTELAKINSELKKSKKSKSSFLLDKFKDSKRQNKDLIEFNISVLKDQISQLSLNSEQLNVEKVNLIKQISMKEDFINSNKSSIEYLALLESKLQQIKLMKDSVVSDIAFDNYLSMTKRYKKYSLVSVLPFSIILTFLMTTFVIIIRYYFDPRILDKEEFKTVFEGVSYLGEVPEFE
jgi:hypothetical protein